MSEPTPDQTKWLDNVAKGAANTYACSWEDIRQHLWLQWLEAGSAFQGYVEAGDTARILVTLQRWAADFGRGEQDAKAAALGDRHWYSRAELRQLLPFVESPEHWSTLTAPGTEDGEHRGRIDPALHGTAMAVYADLRTAWAALSEDERWLLRERFMSPQATPYEELAGDSNGSEDALKKRVERAVSRMQRALGGARRRRLTLARESEGFDDVTGSRHAVSNATAQVYARRVWDG